VKHARDEHAKAIEWLNEHTDDEVAFFLVEMQAWRIGDSKPAPRFNVIERPNDWAKAVKASGDLSKTKTFQLEYWMDYRERALANQEFSREMRPQKPLARHYSDVHIGYTDVILSLAINTQSKCVTCDYYARNNLDLLDEIMSHAAELERLTGVRSTTTRGTKDGRVRFARPDSDVVHRRDEWSTYIDWQLVTALKLKRFIVGMRAGG
jgi:hypothetical protein